MNFEPESFEDGELMSNADVRKATGRYLLMKDGPEKEALGLKMLEAQERLNRAARYERSQHFEPMYGGGVERLEGKFIDLPGMEYSPDPKEDVAAGVNQNYVASEYGLDPEKVGDLWRWYRGAFSLEKFGFVVPSDTELFRLNARREGELRTQRETEERKLGETVLAEVTKSSGFKYGVKSVFGGMSDGSLTVAAGIYRQGAAVLRAGSEASWLNEAERSEWGNLNARQKRLEREQELNAEGGHGDEELDNELGEIRMRIGKLQEVAQARKDQGFREQVASAYEQNAESIGRLKASNAEFYKVSPEFQASFVGKVLYGAGQMVPQVLVAQLPGIGAAALQSQAFEYAYEDAKETAARNGQHFDEKKAFKYAFAVSLQNALLEKAGVDATLGKWVKAGGKKTLVEFLKRIGSGAIGEGMTEAMQGAAGDFVTTRMGIEQRNVFDWSQRWDEFSLGTTLGGIGATARAGAEMLHLDKVAVNQERAAIPSGDYDAKPSSGMIDVKDLSARASAVTWNGFKSSLPQGDKRSTFVKDGRITSQQNREKNLQDDQGSQSRPEERARLAHAAFEKLGVRVVHDQAADPAIVRYDGGGEITLYYSSSQIADADLLAARGGLEEGETTRLIFGEELIHAAMLVNFREKWISSGRSGNFENFVDAEMNATFRDLSSAINSAPSDKQKELLATFRASYHAYFSYNTGIIEKGNLETILGDLKNDPNLVRFLGEFARQTVQLKRQGRISEEFLGAIMKALKTAFNWYRGAVNKIRAGVPGVYRGEFGEHLRQTVEDIEKTLDNLGEKLPPELAAQKDG